MNNQILDQLKVDLKNVRKNLQKLSMDLQKDMADKPSDEGVDAKKDIVNVINAVKNGNFEEAMKLQKKYADRFSK